MDAETPPQPDLGGRARRAAARYLDRWEQHLSLTATGLPPAVPQGADTPGAAPRRSGDRDPGADTDIGPGAPPEQSGG